MNKRTRPILLTLILTLILSACTMIGVPENQPQAPSATPTLPAAPTATLTPTPTPTPTKTPENLVNDGEIALFVGDYEKAYEIFQTTLSQTNDPLVMAASQLGMGQALYEQEAYGLARDHFEQAAAADDAVIAARAQYMLGKTYTRLERYSEAIQAYDAYLTLRPNLLDSHVHELRGDLFTTMGDPAQAVTAYEEATLAEPSGGTTALEVKVAIAYQQVGQQDTALRLYQDILTSADNDYTKAEMDLRIGRIYLEREQPEEAYAYFQDAVTNYPFTYDAYSALVTLVEAGVEVNEYQRGLINYYVGNHALAIEAFDRYLASGAEIAADAALYFKALATRSLDSADREAQHEAAITLWEQIILDYPTSTYFIDAWEDIEYTLWAYLGEPERAAEFALTFPAQRPENPESPNFLFLAGRSFERAGMLMEAAETWARIAQEYPASEGAFRGAYFAGIAMVRLGDWGTAQSYFSRALVLASETEQTAAAYLWIGKCQEALGDISTALDTWKQAQTADPYGHYSIRAEDLLIGQGVLTPPTSYRLDPDLTPYRMEAETWLRTTFNLAPDINLESPGLLVNDPRYQRGLEYWALGDYPAAKSEFESLRVELASDPAQTFRLIPALVDIGLYRSALIASTELLKIANLEGAAALNAPEFFSRVRFGAYYLDWLLPVAESESLSPLLMLALIRQESTYEGFISSGAGARGLMQIIPSTGAQLANEMAWPENYTDADLNRPYISLVFGANYLRKQLNYFNGDLFAMLAAYNGGPGNTIAWKELTPTDDPDLFLEVVRIEETRLYIKLINEIHYVYKWLYGERVN